MVFVGAGGTIDGIANPDLIVNTGAIVRIVIANGDGIAHDIAVPDFTVQTPLLTARGQTGEVTFQAAEAGEFVYYCTVSGHRQIGMEGKVIVSALRDQ